MGPDGCPRCHVVREAFQALWTDSGGNRKRVTYFPEPCKSFKIKASKSNRLEMEVACMGAGWAIRMWRGRRLRPGIRRGSLGRKARLYWLVKAFSPIDDNTDTGSSQTPRVPSSTAGVNVWHISRHLVTTADHTVVLEDTEYDSWRESCLWQAWTPAWLKEHLFLYVASLIHT